MPAQPPPMTATFIRASLDRGGLRGALAAGPDLRGHADVALEDAACAADQRGAAQFLLPAAEIHVEVDDDHALRVLDPDHALQGRREGGYLRGDGAGDGARRGDTDGPEIGRAHV